MAGIKENNCLQTLEAFIHKMELLPPVLSHPELQDAMRDFCDLFHIAKVDALLCDIPNAHSYDPEVPIDAASADVLLTFYNVGEEDETKVFSVTKENHSDNKIVYYIYPKKDSADWTAQEKSRLQTFVAMLYVFNKRAQVIEIAEYLKYHDQEFHMYNANYYLTTVGELIEKGEADGLVACYFCINNLTVINEQLGRANGTQIMLRFARGLEFLLGETGLLCRLGSGNFVALFQKKFMQRVIDYLGGSTLETGQKGITQVHMSANVGLYVITPQCKSAPQLMDRIMFAYETTKSTNAGYYAIYDEKMQQMSDEIKWVESQFDSAIENEEFEVYYQPKVNLNTNTLSGAEALCRWRHNGELISPGHFIPVLEQSNLICVLDFYILEHVCQDIRRWLDEGLSVVRVSVNISRIHLGNEDLATQIFDIINDYNVPYEYIEIELTETTTDVDFNELKRIVRQLRKEGISTAVDDFGVGYSSLNLIRDLPWNVLKIDKSFLPSNSDINSSQKETMLKHVISMAQDLGLECIVEGTETKEQIDLLKGDACFKAQGYFFDQPLPMKEFEKRLQKPQYEHAI